MDLIVAADLGCAIGRKNGLIYSLPEDMKYFRRMTAGKTVLTVKLRIICGIPV